MGLTRITSDGITDAAIVNADINASAAIAGTKISPSFTSDITITNATPSIDLVDSNNNSDFKIQNANGVFLVYDTTNSASRLTIASDGTLDVNANLDANQGIDVTGNSTFVNGNRTLDLTLADSPSTGNVGCQFRAGASDFLGLAAGGGTGIGLVVNDNNQVLIGTTTEGFSGADNLTIEDSGHCGITIRSGATSDAQISFSDATSGDGEYAGQIVYDHTDNFMMFRVNGGSEAMRVKSDGSVGIGHDDPGQLLSLKVGSGQQCQQSLTSATNQSCAIYFGDTDSVNRSVIVHDNANDSLAFNTAALERVRIVSNGEVGINITNPETYGMSGHGYGGLTVQAPSGGYSGITIRSTYNAGGALLFSDGNGSGAELKNLGFASDHVNKRMNFLVEGATVCRFTANGFHPNPADSSASTALTDYEEGTWTPAISGVSYNDAQGTYIKIGTKCFVTLSINQSNTSKSGDTRITGLPFTPKSGSGEYYPADSIPFFEVSGISLSSGYNNVYGRIDYQQGNLQLLVTDGESHGILTAGSGTTLNSNHSLRTSFTYQTV